jgi:hypothetical protein
MRWSYISDWVIFVMASTFLLVAQPWGFISYCVTGDPIRPGNEIFSVSNCNSNLPNYSNFLTNFILSYSTSNGFVATPSPSFGPPPPHQGKVTTNGPCKKPASIHLNSLTLFVVTFWTQQETFRHWLLTMSLKAQAYFVEFTAPTSMQFCCHSYLQWSSSYKELKPTELYTKLVYIYPAFTKLLETTCTHHIS